MPEPLLKTGSTGEAVRQLQLALRSLGYDLGAVDGQFGSHTEAAVKHFQQHEGIAADGIVGKITWQQQGLTAYSYEPIGLKNCILWHNSSTNETQIWFMDGGSVTDRATVLGEDGSAAFVGPPFSIVGVGDFKGMHGNADILWHNSATNETQIWFMDGARVTDRATVLGEDGSAAFVGPPFSIVGVGDFSGDGDADILWHNSATNETQIWFMDGLDGRVGGRATVLGEDGSAAFVGPPFSIVGVGDLNRDNNADILWHNSATNQTQIWFIDGLNGRVISRATVLGEDGSAAFVGPPFSIVGVGDFIWK